MGVPSDYRHSLHISLRGRHNETYRGTLVLKNWTLLYPGFDSGSSTPPPDGSGSDLKDPTGASYYVIAVVLVYGMSIVLLIASHINRKQQKIEQDKQIHKYFQEFMVVKEKSSRDAYKSLKSSIVKKLNWEHNPTFRTLSRAIIPAIAVPVGGNLVMTASELEMAALMRKDADGSSDLSGSACFAEYITPSDTHPGSGGSKQRRKGLGNLFAASNPAAAAAAAAKAPAKEFERSVLERLSELNDIRQEVRARANSITFSATSSLDVRGSRESDPDSSHAGSDLDNRSEDSHVTLPAITVCSPPLEPPMFRRSPLPTIADTEEYQDAIHEEEDDDDGDVTQDIGREDIWLMDTCEPRGIINGGARTPSPTPSSRSRGMQRHVHFSTSTKRRASPVPLVTGTAAATASAAACWETHVLEVPKPQLMRQEHVASNYDEDLSYSESESDDDMELHKITCV